MENDTKKLQNIPVYSGHGCILTKKIYLFVKKFQLYQKIISIIEKKKLMFSCLMCFKSIIGCRKLIEQKITLILINVRHYIFNWTMKIKKNKNKPKLDLIYIVFSIQELCLLQMIIRCLVKCIFNFQLFVIIIILM